MRTLYRILCTLTISALICGSALVARAQQDDQYNDQPTASDQQYDSPSASVDQQDQQYNRDDDQAAPSNQAAPPADENYGRADGFRAALDPEMGTGVVAEDAHEGHGQPQLQMHPPGH